MITNQSTEGKMPLRKKPSEPKEGQSKDQKRSRDRSLKKKELPQFTSLNISYERLLPIIRDLPEFKWPMPIQTDPTQRNKSLWFNYHRGHGQKTDRCRSLKFLVEKLIKPGHFKNYIREIDHVAKLRQPKDMVAVGTAAPS